MTPLQFEDISIRIFGRKGWKKKVAAAFDLDEWSVYRLLKHEVIRGVYEVAIKGLWEQRKREIETEKAARALLPRKLRYKNRPPKPKKPKVNKNAAEFGYRGRVGHPQPGDVRSDETSES